jgi:hypothetical protein
LRRLRRVFAVIGLLLFISAISYLVYTAKQVKVEDLPEEPPTVEVETIPEAED